MASAKLKLLVLCQLVLCTISYASFSSSSPSVIIIGAGMSGISAAKRLSDAGIKDFLILEATNRVGGRIHKTDFAGYTVELGANWLHGNGPIKNPLFEMAKQIHLKTVFSDFSNMSLNTYKQDGGLYPASEVDAAQDMTDETEDWGTKLSRFLNKQNKKNNDMSILAMERLHGTEPNTSLEKAVDFYNYDAEQAEAPRVTSLKYVLPMAEYNDYGEDAFFVADPRGFESLVHLIGRQFLSYKNDTVTDPRVIFNQVVRGISQSKNGVTVTTEDGKVYQAKTVICSVSLGVLQSDLINFKPKLPMWKRAAISEFSIGIYTKIFLKFPYKFWPSGKKTEFFLYVHQRRGYYTAWQHLENEYPGCNVLFVTVVDDESVRVEQQSDEATKGEIMEVLRKMFGKDIPEATDIRIPRWKSDRLYRGSFSNWPVGFTKERHDQLKAPVGKLYFTGEHTHPRFYGYISGAYYAGANTAKDVIGCLKANVCRGGRV